MFAAPPKRKPTPKTNPTSKQHLSKPATIKHPNLSYTRQKLSTLPQSNIINKMASIRTLPPFMYINSDSGNNSQHKSIGYSQSDSEIWKQQYELFDNQSKSSIANIDKQLQDVLGTIRTQRNQIDTKIYKLKQKLQQIKALNKKNKNRQYSETSTITDYLPIHDYLQYQENNPQFLECQTQFPELYQFSAYFKQRIYTLGLSYHKNKDTDQNKEGIVQEYDAGIIDDSTKIKQNKIILEMLLDKLQQ